MAAYGRGGSKVGHKLEGLVSKLGAHADLEPRGPAWAKSRLRGKPQLQAQARAQQQEAEGLARTAERAKMREARQKEREAEREGRRPEEDSQDDGPPGPYPPGMLRPAWREPWGAMGPVPRPAYGGAPVPRPVVELQGATTELRAAAEPVVMKASVNYDVSRSPVAQAQAQVMPETKPVAVEPSPAPPAQAAVEPVKPPAVEGPVMPPQASGIPSRGALLAQGKKAWEPLPPRPEPPDTDGLGTLKKAFPEIARPHELGSEASYGGHRIKRGDREIARVLKKEGEPAAIELNDSDGPGLWDKTVLGDGGKDVAVYLGGFGGLQRKSPEQARQWKRDLIAAVAKGPAPGAAARIDTPEGQAQLERAKEIARLGGLPEQIRDAVRSGNLPKRDGEEMMQKLWGKTLKPQDPRSGDTFREWLQAQPQELRKEWFGATTMGDVDAQNALMHRYVNDWYVKNSSQPGVTRDLMRRVREDLTGKEAGNFKEKFTGAVYGLNNFAASTLGSMAGMAGGIDEDIRNARLAPFSAKARAKLMEKMEIRGRGTTNTLRGWSHFIDKNNPFSDTGRKDQEAQYALGDLKRAIDVLDLQQNGWKEKDQKKIGEAVAAVREKFFTLHEVDQEKGFEIRRDDVDAAKDPALFKALNEYIHTGDPEAWQRFRDRMFADQGTRQLEQRMEEKLRGMNPWQAAYTGGANLDFANLGVEAASMALTAGLGKALGAEVKLLKAAQGVGKGAARGGGALARIGAMGRGIAGAGEGSGFHRLGQVLSPSGKLGKTVGNWLKDTALEAPIGAATEAISEAGDKRATGESMLKAAGTGLLAEAAMGPVMGGAMRVLQEGAKLLPAARSNAEFADYHRAQAAGNPEARELSQEDVDAATGQMDADRYQAIVAEHEAGQREQEAAAAASAAPSTTPVGDAGAGVDAAGNPAAAPAPEGKPAEAAAQEPVVAGGSTTSLGDGAASDAQPGAVKPRVEPRDDGGMALMPVPDRAKAGEGGAAPATGKSPALPLAEASGTAEALATLDGSTRTIGDHARGRGPIQAGSQQGPDTGSGPQGRRDTGAAQNPPTMEARRGQPSGEPSPWELAPMNPGPASRSGEQTGHRPEPTVETPGGTAGPAMRAPKEIEASDGMPQGAEIDSAPLLGLEFRPWDESSARETGHPATGRDPAVAREAERAFRSSLENDYGARGVRLLSLADAPGTQGGPRLRRHYVAGLVRSFERAFGKRVIFYRAESSAQPLPRGGLMPRRLPNYIAVNADGPFSIFFVLGHELGHSIDRQQPELYAAAKREVLALLRDKDSYIAREGLERWYQAEKLDNEVFNDVLGHFFRDAKFWQELGQRNGGLTTKIFTVFAKVVEKMLAAFHSKRGGRDAESMLADHLVEIRKRVADMVDEYRRRGEFPAFVPDPPSRGTAALDGGASTVERLDGDAGGTTAPAVNGGQGRGALTSAGEGASQNAPRMETVTSPSRDSASGIQLPQETRAAVDSAAKAPDARERLGDVRAGRLHALEAYRFFNDKLEAKGGLSPEEQVIHDRATQALAEAVGTESPAADTTTPADRGTQSGRQGSSSAPDVQAAGPGDITRGGKHGAEAPSPSRPVPVHAAPVQASQVAGGIGHAMDSSHAASSAGAASRSASQVSAAKPGATALSSRNAGRPVNRPLGTPADVHAAATAPDARKRLGLVRAGTLHALEAYRFLSDKLRKMGRLAPAEKVKYERAAQALAEAVGESKAEPSMQQSGLQGPRRAESYDTTELERYIREGNPSKAFRDIASRLLGLRDALEKASRAEAAEMSKLPPLESLTSPKGPPQAPRVDLPGDAITSKKREIERSRHSLGLYPESSTAIELRGEEALFEAAREGVALVSRYCHPDRIPKTLEIVRTSETRGAHLPGRIFINESMTPLEIAHEIVHEIEFINDDINLSAWAFLRMRSQTGGEGSLAEVTGQPYESTERAWLDRWWEKGGDPYSGKICDDVGDKSRTETLTVGFERLHSNPLLFLLTDPDYFNFVITNLNPQ